MDPWEEHPYPNNSALRISGKVKNGTVSESDTQTADSPSPAVADGEQVNFSVDEIRGLMDKRTNIRNMSVIAVSLHIISRMDREGEPKNSFEQNPHATARRSRQKYPN